ncbi:MAG TPA: hypothetical protein PLM80_00885 [Mesotoga sp.]|jgi:hypothetical protein|nr:hypothetical protein [Mesotoga sp.]MDI9375356.1 hypothetical protein [Thermotogota bacterium]HPD39564.1 hypothetical protein [Mesotoga infera]MDD4039726.1 hypothetical protein [Mesotoga sp.]MDD4477943.1 hypothetical protein [Mesotoga sp.]
MLLTIIMIFLGLVFLGLAIKLAFFALTVIFGLAALGFVVFGVFWLLTRVLSIF